MKRTRDIVLVRMVKLLHFALSVGLLVLTWQSYKARNAIEIAGRYDLFVYALYAVMLLFFCRTYHAYLVEYARRTDIAVALGLSAMLSIAGVYGITLLAWNRYYPPQPFLWLLLEQMGWNLLWTVAASRICRLLEKPVPTLLVCRTAEELKRLREVDRFPKNYTVVRTLQDPAGIQDILLSLQDCGAVFLAGLQGEIRLETVSHCLKHQIPVFFLPMTDDILLQSGEHISAFSIPLMSPKPIAPEYLLCKRLFDIIASALAIMVTAPLQLAIALAVKCGDGGTIFYRQTRLTKNGRTFSILKFRSMRPDAESDGIPRLAGQEDERITPVGRFLRRTRLDELPQLFNILRGDMSFVGPRPERPEIAAQYEKDIPGFSLRLHLRAGLTGYAQVYGRYNTAPQDKLAMDLLYAERMGPLLDIQLMFATLATLFKKESTQGIEPPAC